VLGAGKPSKRNQRGATVRLHLQKKKKRREKFSIGVSKGCYAVGAEGKRAISVTEKGGKRKVQISRKKKRKNPPMLFLGNPGHSNLPREKDTRRGGKANRPQKREKGDVSPFASKRIPFLQRGKRPHLAEKGKKKEGGEPSSFTAPSRRN